MPVRRNPRGIDLFVLHDEPTARSLELVLLPAGTGEESLAASGCDPRIEQHLIPSLVPQLILGDAHDDEWLIRRDSRRAGNESLEAVLGGAELCLDFLEHAEVVVEDHSVDVALVSERCCLVDERTAAGSCESEQEEKSPNPLPAVRD